MKRGRVAAPARGAEGAGGFGVLRSRTPKPSGREMRCQGTRARACRSRHIEEARCERAAEPRCRPLRERFARSPLPQNWLSAAGLRLRWQSALSFLGSASLGILERKFERMSL